MLGGNERERERRDTYGISRRHGLPERVQGAREHGHGDRERVGGAATGCISQPRRYRLRNVQAAFRKLHAWRAVESG